MDPFEDYSSPPMDSDHGRGSAGRSGGGARSGIGGGGLGWDGSGSGSGGICGENTFAIGGGGASAAAWIRLVSSGVEDELVGTGGGGRVGAGGLPYGHFLDACFLCRKPLASNRDIYMYRGDIPFCSEECRREQIEMDEEIERKEKNTSKKVAPRAPSPRDVESPPRPPKARAGSILAG